jgi:hypothetical protein
MAGFGGFWQVLAGSGRYWRVLAGIGGFWRVADLRRRELLSGEENLGADDLPI